MDKKIKYYVPICGAEDSSHEVVVAGSPAEAFQLVSEKFEGTPVRVDLDGTLYCEKTPHWYDGIAKAFRRLSYSLRRGWA